MTATPIKRPQDRKKPAKKAANKLRGEALDVPVTFPFDGDEFTVVPRQASSLEFLAAIEDEEFIAACRALLGRDQAAMLFRGRTVEDLGSFFEVMGEAVGLGNR